MRCGRCDHENPKNTSHCEACGAALVASPGAAPLNPGRKLTGVAAIPFMPPGAAGPFAPPPAAPPVGPPATPAYVAPPAPPVAAPLNPGPAPFAAFTSGAQQERRTVAEPAPVLPPAYPPGSSSVAPGAPTQAAPVASTQAAPALPFAPPTSVAPTLGPTSAFAPPAAAPAAAAPAAAPAMYTQAAPTAPSPGVLPLAGMPSPFGVPLPVTSASPRGPAQAAPASPLTSPLAPPVADVRPGGRVDPTQLVQAPSVGGAPQLRGALFEYRGAGHHGFIHTLRSGRNVIGRDPSVCDVIIEDDRISKQHAFLFIRGDEVAYLDISSNGSVVDGKLVHGTEVKLASPSVIELGGSRLVFVFAPRRLVDGLP